MAIIGLGNPGEKYSMTRHNVGFRAISNMAEELSITPDLLKFHSLVGEGFLGDEKIILAQPITYMNSSGKAVHALVNNYDISLDDLIIVYDDLDLPPGKIRIKKKGSSGGHNGLKSIIDYLDTNSFIRIRIGIGRPPEGIDIVDYVLGHFTDEEEKVINEALKDVMGAVELIKKESVEEAMNSYN